jgi:hypothetical protein
MGACIMQRDDPLKDLPKLQEPSCYHELELEKAKIRLQKLKGMSISHALDEARMEREEALKRREDYNNKALESLKRYKAMLSKVEQWTPPTPEHIGFKNFMIEQLKKSIEWDCSTDGFPHIPPVISGEQWRQEQIESALRDIAYHTKHHMLDVEQTQGRNRWILALYDSLGVEYGDK